MRTKRLCFMALLTAVALIIFVVEAQIPALAPIPGMKLGLANIVTVYSMFLLGPGDTILILLVRIFLGSVFSGQMMTLLYSLGGGLLCYAVTAVLSRFLSAGKMWFVSIVGAVFHNIGQLLVASVVMNSVLVWLYGPVLAATAIVTGAFTGICAQLLYHRLARFQQFGKERDERKSDQ